MSHFSELAELTHSYRESYRAMLRICKQSSPKAYGEYLEAKGKRKKNKKKR